MSRSAAPRPPHTATASRSSQAAPSRTEPRHRAARRGPSGRPPRTRSAASGAKPRSKRLPRRQRWRLTWLVVALGLAASVLGGALAAALRAPGPGEGQRVVLAWSRATGAGAAVQRLSSAGLLRSTVPFAVAYWFSGGQTRIATGEHVLDDRMSPRELMHTLARSPSRPTRRVVLPEGLHYRQTAERLERAGICAAAAFRAAVQDPALLAELEIPAGSAEGYLFPATYDLLANTPAEEILRRLVSEARARLARLFERHPEGHAARLRDLAGGEHDILTLASIVEKEAQVADERPRIARVYLNRLTDPDFVPRGRLQADPTAGYGCLLHSSLPSCAGYSGRITPEILRDSQNPYNTYRHSGLPPTPIANPGESSIEAVLAPATGNDLFFVAIGGGRHRFSRTYGEHREAIQSRSR